jgi:hypothetical protein
MSLAKRFGVAEAPRLVQRVLPALLRAGVAKRRAGQLLVALEHVYEVLRSEEPLEPAKILLGNFVQDFREQWSRHTGSLPNAPLQLQRATDILRAPALPFRDKEDATWVRVDDVEPLLARERPRAEANAAAAAHCPVCAISASRFAEKRQISCRKMATNSRATNARYDRVDVWIKA